MVSMSIVGSRVPNKNLQKTRTRTHRATKEKERGKRVGTREEEKNSWQCKDACDSSRFDSASSFYIANIYSKEKKKTTNIKKKGRMRFRLDGSRSKLAHRGIVFLLNDGFQIMEILDYRSVANRYFFGKTFGFYKGFELRSYSQTQFDCESIVILSKC